MITIAFFVTVILIASSKASPEDLIYGYECRQQRCVKVELNASNFGSAISLPVCRMFCSDTIGTLWPKPTGSVAIEPYLLHIEYINIDYVFPPATKKTQFWEENKKRFQRIIKAQIPDESVVKEGGHHFAIQIEIDESNTNLDETPKLTLDTDESYKLLITPDEENKLTATISAKNFFGARHGLETLAQLIVYDDIRREVQVPSKARIEDAPKYKWRGLLLDTSRNYYSVKAIKRTLDAMAMVKLNTLHWHITDSHSFPIEIKSQPELYKLGAYSPRKIYSHEDIINIVEYGRVRGIRVMPEFDAPAHVGEGWQHTNMTACFNYQPWSAYCVEPPCGQLDPTVDKMYAVLEDIYREMFELFDPDVFHMGGDEVSVSCWNSSEHIRNWMLEHKMDLQEKDFIELWNHFQSNALKRVDAVSNSKNVPIILWTSRLTDLPYMKYLNNDRYIIQIWTKGADSKVQDILKRGFRIIVSNYDALYFDCGAAGWVTDGQNWCSPYIGWQTVYMNNLKDIGGASASLILGAEATIWSEQIDELTLDARLWPRASALAERLWTDSGDHWRQAEPRILLHRERLTANGISAEALQPEWCLQNENQCPINSNIF